MCTAISLTTQDHYFGRNLDLEYSYIETITITPRNYPFPFRQKETIAQHYAMIGTAFVQDNYPLYYDATNEKGLSMAGLNFPDNAYYFPSEHSKDNITPYEFIPWILGQCATVAETRELLENLNLLKESFSKELPLSPLHWMIADKKETIVVESVEEGLRIHDNPVGVLTNNPPFEMQLFHLNNYMNLSNDPPKNHFSKELDLRKYSNGMGAMGLPGDWSSQSRFVRASFAKMNSKSEDSEKESVNQFFHLLGSVEFPRGSVEMKKDIYEITVYSSCCNTDKGIYYYKTYENFCITAVDIHKENLDSAELICYPMRKESQITWQN
ncbi:MAG: choloylglycine hydrolase [Agathobacter sp.]|nr:choloylglycine hydrolase [Agathobacter sp.]